MGEKDAKAGKVEDGVKGDRVADNAADDINNIKAMYLSLHHYK
ncbi:hypothetical protein OAI84_00530 [bacterium]|nr:hypothetical protein [bacterium]